MDKEDFSVMRTAILTAFPKIFTDIEFSSDIFYQALQIADAYNFSFQPELFVAQMAVEIEARFKATSMALYEQIKAADDVVVIELAAGLSPRSLQFDKVPYFECDLKPIIELKKQIFKNLGFQEKTKNFYDVDLVNLKQFKSFLTKINRGGYKKVVILSEGLFWYMKREDIQAFSQILLQTFGKKMIWISADCPVKKVSNSEYRKVISNSANSKRNTFESMEDFYTFFQDLGFEVAHRSLNDLIKAENLSTGKIFAINKPDLQKRMASYVNIALISPKS